LARRGQSGADIDAANRARKIASKHQINWPDILPLTTSAKSQREKIKGHAHLI
jgi:hypothetical protein